MVLQWTAPVVEWSKRAVNHYGENSNLSLELWPLPIALGTPAPAPLSSTASYPCTHVVLEVLCFTLAVFAYIITATQPYSGVR